MEFFAGFMSAVAALLVGLACRRFISRRHAVWEVMWGKDEGRILVTLHDRRDLPAMEKLDQIVTRWLREGWLITRHPGMW